MNREEELDRKERELYEAINKIREEKEEIKQHKINEKKKEIEEKIEFIKENKDIILPLIKHDRSSCSDEHPCNGYSSYNNDCRCRKCFLMEILDGDWGNEYDINLDVSFIPVEDLV